MNFRNWLQEKYFEHKDECSHWNTIPASSVKEYFNKYKWWLKREYKFQLTNNKK